MLPTKSKSNESLLQWAIVRPEPPGQFTAQLLGLPELTATAASRDEAIEQIRARVLEWIALGHLVPVEISKEHPLVRFQGWREPNDPEEKVFLEELARLKAEDLERTLREYAEEDQQANSLRNWPGHDPEDPLEKEFVADLERFRQEDLERLAREAPPDDQPCSNTSSTPTT